MNSPSVTGTLAFSPAVNGSTPNSSSRRATIMAKHRESRPDSSSANSSDKGGNVLFCSVATCLNWDSTVDLTVMMPFLRRVLFEMTLARHEELGIGRYAPVSDLHQVDQVGRYRGAGDSRSNLRAPMHSCRRIIDDHCEDRLVAELECLDQQGEPRANLVKAGR